MIHVICYICREMGFSAAPNELSEYPDYPRKSDDMTIEEYQKITKKYWKSRVTKLKQEKKRVAREIRVQQILENLIPKHLTDHPDFPEKIAEESLEDYAEKVDKYWTGRRKDSLKRKSDDQNSESPQKSPKKRKIDDISEEEQNIIVDERVLLSISKETVAEKHDTDISVVNEIITNYNLKQHEENDNKKPTRVDFKFNCATCKVQCPCEAALNAHLAGKQHKKKLESSKVTIFCCGICKIETSNQGGLDMHLAGKNHLKKVAKLKNADESELDESSGEQKFRCEICKIETSNQAGLDQHISGKNHQKKVSKLGVENGKGPFRCEICDVNASNQAALDLHLIGRAHRFQIENL